MHLKLLISPESMLSEMYSSQIKSRNFEDSGFDLYTPCDIIINGNSSVTIDFELVAVVTDDLLNTYPFQLCSRSSISKTPLILQNGIGVIDKGYRGKLKAAFWNLSSEPYLIKADTRLAQICARDLKPFTRITVESELCMNTVRGTGGFGSTGFAFDRREEEPNPV